MNGKRRVWGAALVTASLIGIAFATLLPEPGPSARTFRLCVTCGDYGVQDFILNVVLFVPLGVGMSSTKCRRWHALGLMFALALGIEFAQLHYVAGRASTAGDVIANTFGGWIGFAVSRHWKAILLPLPARAARYVAAGLLVAAVAAVATTWSFATDAGGERHFGQLAPRFARYDQFDGRVIGASVDDHAFPSPSADEARQVRQKLERGGIALALATTAGHATTRLAPIASIFDERRQLIFMVSRQANDAVLQLRINANRAGFRAPMLRLRGAFLDRDGRALAAGDTVRLDAVRDGARYVLRSGSRHGGSSTTWSASAASGWTLLAPYDYALGDFEPLATVAWLGVPLALLGWWASLAWSPRARRHASTPIGAATIATS